MLSILLVLATIFLLATGLAGQMFGHLRAEREANRAAAAARVEAITQGQQANILAEGNEAAERNKLIPVAGLAGGALAPFRAISPEDGSYAVAKKCLTQAIYYEAGSEPVDGMRAVAQVVLNRVRHPAYPHSVCGVVYQGWNQPVCQFTFVCDGSLLRRPSLRMWREAEAVATEALAGSTEPAVGSATNYHADYVLPRWAYTLPKVTQIGAHIFYRLPGQWGSVQALSAHWDGSEFIPRIDVNALRLKLLSSEQAVESETVKFVPGLTVTPLVSDRHAPADVGGRLDTTKAWRLEIPLPVDGHRPSPIASQPVVQGQTVREEPVS